MGHMKNLEIRLRGGGDDAVAAACELMVGDGEMTPRDRFAAAALTGLIMSIKHDDAMDEVCAWAYQWADAMVMQGDRLNVNRQWNQ